MILDTTAKSVQIVLGEPASTANCDITSSYVDQNYTAQTLVPGAKDLVTNGVTPVTAVPAPPVSIYRQIKEIHVYNNDTVTHTVFMQLLNDIATRIIRQGTVIPGGAFDYYWDGLAGAPGPAGPPGATGGVGPVVTKTTNYGVMAADSQSTFDNGGASGTVIFTLPGASPGLRFSFIVLAAQLVEVLAGGSDQIAIGSQRSAVGGTVQNNIPYSFISLIAPHGTPNLWVTQSLSGAWSLT